MVLSDRSRGLITAADLGRMKKTAYLVNTSRGPIVEEKALIAALQPKAIAGAGLDVFGKEPLPLDHPYRKMDNVVITPHLGYVSAQNYAKYFPDIVEDIRAWLDGKPVRVIGSRNRDCSDRITTILPSSVANLTAFARLGLNEHFVVHATIVTQLRLAAAPYSSPTTSKKKGDPHA